MCRHYRCLSTVYACPRTHSDVRRCGGTGKLPAAESAVRNWKICRNCKCPLSPGFENASTYRIGMWILGDGLRSSLARDFYWIVPWITLLWHCVKSRRANMFVGCDLGSVWCHWALAHHLICDGKQIQDLLRTDGSLPLVDVRSIRPVLYAFEL